jgi:hypothetical protein
MGVFRSAARQPAERDLTTDLPGPNDPDDIPAPKKIEQWHGLMTLPPAEAGLAPERTRKLVAAVLIVIVILGLLVLDNWVGGSSCSGGVC